jgi:hypothetical protein
MSSPEVSASPLGSPSPPAARGGYGMDDQRSASSAVDHSQIIQVGIKALARADWLINVVLSHNPSTPSNPFRGIISESAVIEAIEGICASQALAFACLFDTGNRSTESNRMKNLRLERVASIRARMPALKLTELVNRGPRNALAHLDERLLKAQLREPDGGWVTDLAFSHRDLLSVGADAEQRMLRVYFYDIDSCFILGEVLRLRALRAEIDQVLGALGLQLDRSGLGARR